MSETINKYTQTFFGLLAMVAVVFGLVVFGPKLMATVTNSPEPTKAVTVVKANLDAAVIIKSIQKESKLTVLTVSIQTTLPVEVSETVIEAQKVPVLNIETPKVENWLRHEYMLIGSRVYSYDLSKLTSQNLICNTVTCEVTNLPDARVEAVIDQQNTQLLKTENNVVNRLSVLNASSFINTLEQKMPKAFDAQATTKILKDATSENQDKAKLQATDLLDELIKKVVESQSKETTASVPTTASSTPTKPLLETSKKEVTEN